MAAPVFNGLDNNPGFTENGAAVRLDGNATISDADIGPSVPFTGATLTLARAGGASPDDFFADNGGHLSDGQVTVTGTIPDPEDPNQTITVEIPIGSYVQDGGTLTITFNDQATNARVNTILQSLTYANTSNNPPSGSVVIAYTFDDGEQAQGSITVGITGVNDSPAIDGTTFAYYQPGTAGVVLSPGIQLIDDSATLSGATVSLSAHDTTDHLSANVGATGITASYDPMAGVLTLSGSASVEAYRQVLATVAYSSTATEPMSFGVPRTVTWQVVDDGALTGGQSSTLDFFPYLDLDQSGAGTGFSTAFTEGGAGVAVVDTDDHIGAGSNDFASATIALTNAQPGDILSASGLPSGITADTSVPGQLTLTAGGSFASAATFEDALRHVVFGNPNANLQSGARDIAVTVKDAVNTSNVAHTSIAVTAVNNPGSAADDTAATNQNTVLQVAAAQGVLANDNDPDGLTVITGTVGTSAGGTIHFNPDGSYTYSPAVNFSGNDSVGYTAQDPFGSQVNATLKIAVNAAQHNGSPGNDTVTSPSGTSTFDGGAGVDTIAFDFKLVDASVSYVGNAVIIDGPSSHTVLTGFEVFNFTDGTVNNSDSDPLVDDLFYYSKYHDVWTAHADADAHYHAIGWHEGRDPDAFFSTVVYLSANPDVRAAGVDPLTHFDQTGWKEGRTPSINFDPAAYLAANPDVQAAHIDPLAHFLQYGAGEGRQPIAPTELLAANGFDFVYYLQHNPDVAAAGVDPLRHFETVGWQEGRNPNALFDTAGYLANYVDVAAAHINPLDHYNQFGWHEGRDPSVAFDTTSYLSAYADVAAAHINPLNHFLDSGIHEGRSPFADGVWG